MFNKKAYQKKYMAKYMPAYYKSNKQVMIEQIKKRKLERVKENKLRAIKMLGGKCQRCGYNKCIAALDFHHAIEEKEFNISKYMETWSIIEKEIEKCVLLCANCHREEHYKCAK